VTSKQLVDSTIALDANGRTWISGRVSSDDQAHRRSGSGQRDSSAIVERPRHTAFRVGADLIWRVGQALLHHFEVQQMVGPASHDHRKLCREYIEQGRGISIQAI